MSEVLCGSGGSPKGEPHGVCVKEGGEPRRDGNGRNVGLGLLTRFPQSSRQPRVPEEGQCFQPPLDPASPWQDATKKLDNCDLSTSVSSSAPGGTGNAVASVCTQSAGMMRARFHGLLLKGEESDECGSEEDGRVGDRARGNGKTLPEKPTTSRTPLQKRKSAQNILDHNSKGKDSGSSGMVGVASAMAMQVRSKLMSSFPSPCFSSSASSASIARPPGSRGMCAPRNSQLTYAESEQTAIVFDWDDTLFPTSYLLDELRLNHSKPLRKQRLPPDLLGEVEQILTELEASVSRLLEDAHRRGKVILVTLARSPWIEESCTCFFRKVGELIRRLNIKVVYAQEGVAQVDYDKRKMASDEDIEWMYAEMKGKAISQEVEAFYSQYEGQTWKNIISIGDSDFERLGTMMMSQEYMRRRGLLKDQGDEDMDPRRTTSIATNQALRVSLVPIEVDGHVYKVRTKTFKMLDCPTIGELKEEVDLIRRWLPQMVALDDGFDADLSALDDRKLLDNIEQVLHVSTKSARTKARRAA